MVTNRGLRCGFVGFRFLLCLVTTNFIQTAIVSINGVLYPPQAKVRGLNAATYGFVLSFFRWVLTIFLIVIGMQVERFGVKSMYVYGLCLISLSPLFFSLVTYVTSASIFLVLSFILQGLEAVGTSAFLASLYMWPCILFPGKVSLVFGVIQTGHLLSGAVGPLFGALLDTSFGLPVTYLSFGCIQLVGAIWAALVLPKAVEIESISVGPNKLLQIYWKLLKIPSVAMYVYACAVSGGCADAISAVLQPTLESFGIGEMGTGWTFMLMAAPYLAGPLWGHLIDRAQRAELFLLAGAVSLIFVCIFLGPFPGIPPSFTLLAVSLFCFGFTHGLLTVSAISILRLELIQRGFEENLQNISFVSIGYLSASSLGAGCGPLLSGLIYNSFGFPAVMIQIVSINLILVILVLCKLHLNPVPDATITNGSECDPLLSSEK